VDLPQDSKVAQVVAALHIGNHNWRRPDWPQPLPEPHHLGPGWGKSRTLACAECGCLLLIAIDYAASRRAASLAYLKVKKLRDAICRVEYLRQALAKTIVAVDRNSHPDLLLRRSYSTGAKVTQQEARPGNAIGIQLEGTRTLKDEHSRTQLSDTNSPSTVASYAIPLLMPDAPSINPPPAHV
jgi:hypothetical protein